MYQNILCHPDNKLYQSHYLLLEGERIRMCMTAALQEVLIT